MQPMQRAMGEQHAPKQRQIGKQQHSQLLVKQYLILLDSHHIAMAA